jgi:hypothetical protein
MARGGSVNFRQSLTRAIEALEDGDEVYAAAIIRHAIEHFDGSPIGRNRVCIRCGLGPLWPGELDDHMRHGASGRRTPGCGMTVTAHEGVTENVSAQVAEAVTCNTCLDLGDLVDGLDWTSKRYGADFVHCTACHGDGHRACQACGACLRGRIPSGAPTWWKPKQPRLDRYFCSTTCRVRAHKERARNSLERAAWEAENPEAAAIEQAERARQLAECEALAAGFAAMSGGPEGRKRRQRFKDLQARAERCATCDEPFRVGDVIHLLRGYRQISAPVLPYCAEHRCTQYDGHHNRDAREGYHYKGCTCEDQHWTSAEPCVGCGRLVAYPRNAGWRRVRDWSYHGEAEPAKPRVFCGRECKRRVRAIEAKSRRLAARAERSTRCEICDEPFTSKRADARYCSSACRQRAYRERAA